MGAFFDPFCLVAIYGYYFNRCISEKSGVLTVTLKCNMLLFKYASLPPTTFPIAAHKP